MDYEKCEAMLSSINKGTKRNFDVFFNFLLKDYKPIEDEEYDFDIPEEYLNIR